MAKIYRCGLDVTTQHGGRLSVMYGYGSTAEKAMADAKATAKYRNETPVPGAKPHIDRVEESTVRRTPMAHR